jgi:hypothetical protein
MKGVREMTDMTLVTSDKLCVKPSDIPPHVASGIARATLRAVARYFENPDVQAEFEEWMKARNKEKGLS